jgi:Spy/CpxP family protein refolding chaperone
MRRRMIMLAAMLTMVSASLLAQRQGHFDPQKAADRQTEEMNEVLKLDETQYASVKEINNKYAEKAEGLRKEAVGERRELRERFQTLRSERQQEINTVLTKDQQAKWEQHRELKKRERRESVAERQDERRKQMKEDLKLSDEQGRKLEELQKAHREEVKKVWENRALTQEERTTEIKKLREQHDAGVKAVLTPDQYAKWSSGKENRKGLYRKNYRDKR